MKMLITCDVHVVILTGIRFLKILTVFEFESATF